MDSHLGGQKRWETIWPTDKQVSQRGLGIGRDGTGRPIHLGICLQKRKLGNNLIRDLMSKPLSV